MATVKELEDRVENLENFIKNAFQIDEIPPADAPDEEETDEE